MLESVSDVAECFMIYLNFCVNKTCNLAPAKTYPTGNVNKWFDETCRSLRTIALNDPDNNKKLTTYKKK